MRNVLVVRPRVPLFNDNLKMLRAKRRKLERTMVKSGLPADKEVYHKVCDIYFALPLRNPGILTTHTFSTNALVSKKLFRVVNSLTKEHQDSSLIPH